MPLCLALTASTCLNADETRQRALLLTQLQWVRFDVVLGRVLATTNRTDQNRSHVTEAGPADAHEKLFVTVDEGLISLRYQCTTPTTSLHIEVVRRGVLQIRREQDLDSSAARRTIVYAQPLRGAVTLEVTSNGEPPMQYQAASLWHLMLAHPLACREYLIPTLELLRPNWNLEQDRRDILVHLRNYRPEHLTVSRREVMALVEQLNDPRFRVRQLADRQLRAMGQCVLMYLESIEADMLGAEQRERLDQIHATLAARTIDAPACVAAKMACDKSVWLTLLAEEDATIRVVAKKHLASLCQRDIDFDPAAEPAQRAQQLAHLRDQLLRR